MALNTTADREQLSKLMDNISIEAFLDREGIDYRSTFGSSGAQYNLKTCPCCGGDQWKVYLNADSGLGNCFSGSCETKFNKWKFISASTGLNGKELVDFFNMLAGEQGYMPKKKTAAIQTRADLILPESYGLPVLGKNLKYLENRNISGEVAQYFHLRYSKEGVFKYKSDGKTLQQDYSKRIIIPIFDMSGKMVSFQGRDITDEAGKKYLFPPGYAATGVHLYNAQNAIGAERILINEGVFDVYAAHIAVSEDTSTADIVPVGSFGKHLSYGQANGNDQLGKLIALKALGLKEVTFMWDGEAKALTDAVHAALRVLELGLRVRVAALPKGKDPNEVAVEIVRAAYWQASAINKASAAKILLNPNALLK